jgi:iron complex transport system ATP-binding protein
MSRLEARNLTVRRGGRTILSDVSVAAGAGEFVVLIGPNGAGKSTLLSALAGLIAPQSGTVRLDGTTLCDMVPKALARRRAYLPQNPHLEWPLSVERLVALGLTPHLPAFGGLPPDVESRVDAALAAFDLIARRDQPATTLSGGEFARAMLARAMVASPDILIVDEPVTGLDPRHALDSMARLKAYAAEGRLVIASLHDLTLAARFADRLVALKEGRVAGEGPLPDILTPALIEEIFETESEVLGAGANVTVNFLVP